MTTHDEDYDDPRQRCQHGTFIGSWWGPDYLCGWCEDGISVHEMHRILAEQRAWRDGQRERNYDALLEVLAKDRYDVRVAQALTDYVLSTA